MFSIKVNTSPIEGTNLNKRDSMSLFYNGEEISNFTFADSCEKTTRIMMEKVERIYPFIKMSLWVENFGFSGFTLTTPDTVTTKHSLDIPMEKMDLFLSDIDFDERFEKAQDSLERLNQGVKAFVYTLTHTPEEIVKEIKKIEKRLSFLKSL